MVNEDTRSAAEMLAGALRDTGRAVVVGTRTYGKGVLQDGYPLVGDVTLRLTTARYFLPRGEQIHRRGVQPDISVAQEGDGDKQLEIAAGLLQTQLSASSGHSSPWTADSIVNDLAPQTQSLTN